MSTVTQDNCTLLPCPFCGPGQSQVDLWFDDVAKRYRVGCGRCGCSTGIDPRDKTEAPAIANWNKRPTPPADMEGVEAAARGILSVFVEATDESWARYRGPDAWKQFVPCARAALAALAAALPALQRTVPPLMVMKEDGTIERVPDVPDGWQLVPKDPTAEMMDAGNAAREASISIEVNTFATWHAMLAAAPVLADHRGAK